MKKSTLWTVAAFLGAILSYSVEAFGLPAYARYAGMIAFAIFAIQAYGAREAEKAEAMWDEESND